MISSTSSSNKKQRVLIIFIALCIHVSLGVLLFLLEPTYLLLNSHEAQIILFDEHNLNKSLLNQQNNVQAPTKNTTSLVPTAPEEWGEMLGRNNNFGLPNGNMIINTAVPLSTNSSPQKPACQQEKTTLNTLQEKSDHEKLLAIDQTQSDKKINTQKSTPDKKTHEPFLPTESGINALTSEKTVDQPINTTALTSLTRTENQASNNHTSSLSSDANKNNSHQQIYSFNTPAKHTSSGLTLAAIGRGFIEETRYNGDHNITMLGKKGGIVTAEQLKIERYVERLSWCLQNSFKLLRNTIDHCITSKTEVYIYLQLDRSGSIQDLKLLKSCGNATLDNYTLTVFKNAGTSFPPIPTYIKTAPFSISYHIDYGVDENRTPLSFSLQR